MEPTSLPDNDDGWVIDKGALFVAHTLRAFAKGDELMCALCLRSHKFREWSDETMIIEGGGMLFSDVTGWRPRGKQHS
jgi:hypothetical protein